MDELDQLFDVVGAELAETARREEDEGR